MAITGNAKMNTVQNQSQIKRKAGKSRYWWKDKSGNWHYHIEDGKTVSDTIRPEGPPDNSSASATKPKDSSTVATGVTASGGRPATGVGVTLDPNFIKSTKPMPLPNRSTGTSKMTPPPGGGKAQAKADWKGGWQPPKGQRADAGKKASHSSVKPKTGLKMGGKGLTAVDSGEGSRKVYDDARARLLKKKRGNQSYRPQRIKMKVADIPPTYCSACHMQRTEIKHVDFEAYYDGPVMDGLTHKQPIDDLILCSDCLKPAAMLLGMIDNKAMQTQNYELGKAVEEKDIQLEIYRKAISDLENTLGLSLAGKLRRGHGRPTINIPENLEEIVRERLAA